MKKISQEIKSLTTIEFKILTLLKKHTSQKISIFSLQQEQHIFYIALKNEIILSKPFTDERRLFHFLIEIEPFIIQNVINKITVITTNKTATLLYPFADVKLVSYDVWASKF